jgi:hypothetical protein
VPSWLAEILQILGWDTVPGIALEELPLSGSGQAVSTGWIPQ